MKNTLDFSECGGNFTNTNGIITSPSYPHPYPHNADCVYVISYPVGTYVEINVTSIEITCIDAGPDYLELRDGASGNSPVIGIFCGDGDKIPASLETTQNQLRIR